MQIKKDKRIYFHLYICGYLSVFNFNTSVVLSSLGKNKVKRLNRRCISVNPASISLFIMPSICLAYSILGLYDLVLFCGICIINQINTSFQFCSYLITCCRRNKFIIN